MKEKQKVDLIISLILIANAILVLILPIFGINNVKNVCLASFSIIAISNITQYLLTRKNKDYEGLYTFIVSLFIIFLIIILNISNNPKNLSLVLMIWITLMSIIKFKKSDYYNDRNDRMWKIKIFSLVLFIITGILTSINLAHDSNVQIIIIGFFLLIHGILEFIDPVVKRLIQHS